MTSKGNENVNKRERKTKKLAWQQKYTKMDDEVSQEKWGQLVEKEFRDVFSDTEGEEKDPPGQKERERRLDKRREFGPEQQNGKQMWGS